MLRLKKRYHKIVPLTRFREDIKPSSNPNAGVSSTETMRILLLEHELRMSDIINLTFDPDTEVKLPEPLPDQPVPIPEIQIEVPYTKHRKKRKLLTKDQINQAIIWRTQEHKSWYWIAKQYNCCSGNLARTVQRHMARDAISLTLGL